MQLVLSALRRAVQDYQMIFDGDSIVVGVSGGKDSMLLLAALKAYQRFSPEKFELQAVHIDAGFSNIGLQYDADEMTEVEAYCDSIDTPLKMLKTDIAQIVFDIRREANPCSLCAKMRRGALNSAVKELGANKLALGHNADDIVETMLLSLIYEGRFSTFHPTTFMDRSGVELIRPLLYMDEADIIGAVNRLRLPVLRSPCPVNEHTKREAVKDLVKTICALNPQAKDNMLGAIYHPERNNLWDKK